MAKLSENQQGALDALKRVTADKGVAFVSKAVWKQACDDGISVNTAAMLKTGAVKALLVSVSSNGKTAEIYAPAE